MRGLWFGLFVLAALVQSISALKILFYSPRFGKSHVMFVGKLADQLAAAGHEIVLYQPIVRSEMANTTGMKKPSKIIERWPTYNVDKVDMTDIGTVWDPSSDSFSGGLKMMSTLGNMFKTSCEDQLRDNEMLEKLKAENCDLGMTEFFDVCGVGIFRRIGLYKTIVLYASSMPPDHSAYFGIPATPSYVPGFVVHKDIDSFGGRISNVVSYLLGKHVMMSSFLDRTAEAYAVFDSKLDYRTLIADASMVFVNAEEHIDFARPISHKIIYIGGVGMQEALAKKGKLEEKYEKVFHKAKTGVIFMSFGSVAQSYLMPPEIKKAFLDAFDEFPDIQFMWKYEKPEDKIAEGHPNVFTDNWLPQTEIFGNSKLLGFITHGGMNSITEASYAGVPMICIPLFADQTRNSYMAEHSGLGIRLFKTDLNKEAIVKAIRRIVETDEYRTKAKNLSKLIRSKPMNPDQRLIQYTEFAGRYNIHESLDITARNLNFFSFYSLDVYCFLLIVISIFLLGIFFAVRSVFRFLFKSTKQKQS